MWKGLVSIGTGGRGEAWLRWWACGGLFGGRLPLANMFVELGIGGEGPWLLVKERFDAAAEGGVVGCVVLDVQVDEFIEAAEVGKLGVVVV